jgi:predicted GNAT family N-acyltransferase
MSAPDVPQDDLAVVEAPHGSDLYSQAVGLREAILRRPLGLVVTAEELADDLLRVHFCATSYGAVVGTVSLRPLDGEAIQLKQMAVAEERRRERIGAQLLASAEDWARRHGFRLMVLNARLGAEGFYARYGYLAEGEPFDENTLPHVRMTKTLAGRSDHDG